MTAATPPPLREIEELERRVEQFNCMELPGQIGIHMGTSYLVNDLWRSLSSLKHTQGELEEARRHAEDMADDAARCSRLIRTWCNAAPDSPGCLWPACDCGTAAQGNTSAAGATLIWSNEHRAWWRPNSAGYTVFVAAAGRYSREEAVSICRTARNGFDPESVPTEIPVREADVLALSPKEPTDVD